MNVGDQEHRLPTEGDADRHVLIRRLHDERQIDPVEMPSIFKQTPHGSQPWTEKATMIGRKRRDHAHGATSEGASRKTTAGSSSASTTKRGMPAGGLVVTSDTSSGRTAVMMVTRPVTSRGITIAALAVDGDPITNS
jgi:hypothetical protein